MLAAIILSGVAEFVYTRVAPQTSRPAEMATTTGACPSDAKVCPDGTSVGRSAPSCEFTACPDAQTQSTATLLARIGEKGTGLSVDITPLKVIQDSRCPKDVQCIWAGTVEVSTKIKSGVFEDTVTFKLDEPQQFGAETVTLKAVSPDKGQEAIAPTAYRFVYQVTR